MARSTSMIPVRVGFMPTPVKRTSASGWTDAATIQKAAAEMSFGTRIESGASGTSGLSRTAGPSRPMRAPIAASMRSVWSRVGSGSSTIVSPSAKSPASRMLDFTCADATGMR